MVPHNTLSICPLWSFSLKGNGRLACYRVAFILSKVKKRLFEYIHIRSTRSCHWISWFSTIWLTRISNVMENTVASPWHPKSQTGIKFYFEGQAHIDFVCEQPTLEGPPRPVTTEGALELPPPPPPRATSYYQSFPCTSSWDDKTSGDIC